MAVPDNLSENSSQPTADAKAISDAATHKHGYDRHSDGRLHQDLAGASVALANLHGDLREKTIAYQSGKALFKFAGFIGGAFGGYRLITIDKNNAKKRAEAALSAFNDKLLTIACKPPKPLGQATKEDAALLESHNNLIHQLLPKVQAFEAESQDVNLTKHNESIINEAKTIINQHFDTHLKSKYLLLSEKIPEESYRSHFLTVVKGQIIDKDRANTKRADALLDALGSKRDLISAFEPIRDKLENIEHGILSNTATKIVGFLAATFGGMFLASAIHHVMDRKRKYSIDALTDEVNGLNRIMLAHDMPTVDMNEIPAKTYAARVKQVEAIEAADKEKHVTAIKEELARRGNEKKAAMGAEVQASTLPSQTMPPVVALSSLQHDGIAAHDTTQHHVHTG